MRVCRICLATDTKLYDMNYYNLKACYEALTNYKLAEGRPQWLCWECAFRLLACTRFRHKAQRSQALLAQLSYTQYNYTQQLQSIDRQKHDLTSTLVCTQVSHTGFHLHETEEPTEDIQRRIQEVNIDEATIDHDVETLEFDLDPESSSDEILAKRKKPKKVKKKDKEQKIDRRRKPASEVLNEAVFSITDLTLEEQIELIRRRKETANYKNSVLKCEDCFKGFLDEDAYSSHIIRHTDASGTFVCEVCKTHFKLQHALRNHTASHAQQFRCKCCSYVTTRRHAAKLHEEWHNGTRYQCPHCQEDFVKFSTYMGHIRIKHPSDWVCPLCGYSFVSEKGLQLHSKLKHRFNVARIDENGPYCQRCDVRFASQAALDQHTKLSPRHDAEKQENGCPKRGRRVAAECEREGKPRRSRTDKPEGPIPCEQCDMQLPDSLSYYRHFRRTHPDKNRTNYPSMKTKSMCEVCGKMFQSLALLQDHSFTHTDSKLFKCQQCDKSFQRRYRLIAHRRLHAARPQHACAACGKRFSSASNRARHMASHTGLKPFKCEMCGKCFKHAPFTNVPSKFSTYMGHIRIKHPSDWVCPLCGYSFVSEKGLQLHSKLKHRFNVARIDENGPYCQRCDVRFASQAALDQHTKLSPRHDAEKQENGCPKRGRRVAAECEREGKPRRSRTDKPEGPIPCEQCDMQLPDSLSYYRHFRRTHPDKNRTNYPSMKTKSMCEVCGKMFQSLALLQDHSFTHTDSKLFKCQQCDKSFQRRYRLIAQHACAACGKRFSSASNRARHMASHTGLKPFKCEMCGKCFKHASEKRAHITYVHLKKPWPKRARGKRRDSKVLSAPMPQELVQPLWTTENRTDKPMYNVCYD